MVKETSFSIINTSMMNVTISAATVFVSQDTYSVSIATKSRRDQLINARIDENQIPIVPHNRTIGVSRMYRSGK